MTTTYLRPIFVRSLGIAGALGGILCFIGDMLYYYVDGSTNTIENMGVVEFDRIIWSCLLSFPTSWFYLAGSFQVYLAFQPAAKVWQAAVGLGMVMIVTGWGLVHANFVTYAVAAQLARKHQLDLAEAVTNAGACQGAMRNWLYAIFAAVSLLFLPLVLTRSTHYPRWMCAAYPLLLLFLEVPIAQATLAIHPNVYLVIIGGYLNLMMVVFFSCSTIALWNVKISCSITLPLAEGSEEETQLQ